MMTSTWVYNGELYRLEIGALSARFCVCADEEWIVLAEPRRASSRDPFPTERLPEAVREMLRHPPFVRLPPARTTPAPALDRAPRAA